MCKPTTSFDDLDLVLGRFFQELEQSQKPESVLDSYCQHYPQHAAELQNIFRLRPIVRQGDGLECSPIPKQLGDFKLVRLIGCGGMGEVYEAIQIPFNRRVVVKVIRRGKVSPAARERFLREQRVLAGLHESHIVPVFAGGEDHDIQYFAMPFIDGATLRSIVQTASQWDTVGSTSKTPEIGELAKAAVALEESSRKDRSVETATLNEPAASPYGNKPLPREAGSTHQRASRRPGLEFSMVYFRSAAEITAQVADSLDHAHQHGFLHRDIKPSNIMVSTNGQSWVIDFGLVRSIRGDNVSEPDGEPAPVNEVLTHGIVGTLGYMAPEQERHESIDARTDVWALGATLYELLTLKPAYPPQENFTSLTPVSPKLVLPRRILPQVPRDLEAICAKALRLDPGSRYASCRELGRDLRRWLAGEPTVARPARTARRSLMWANRNRGWASAMLVAIMALLITTALAGINTDRARKLATTSQRVTQLLQVETAISGAHQTAMSAAHVAGWSEEAWDKVRRAAEVETDGQLRNLAMTLLTAMDARRIKSIDDFGGQYVTFDPSGQRLLIGSVFDRSRKSIDARIWNLDTAVLENLAAGANGPIAFRPDGTPIQLSFGENSIDLIDLTSGKSLCQPRLPERCTLSTLAAMPPDGSRIAAGGLNAEGKATVWIWDGAAGTLLQTLVGDATVIAFSPDGFLLACGSEGGQTQIWSVPTGQELCALHVSDSPIEALAFSASRKVPSESPAANGTEGWLLATGDGDGLVTLWDLSDRLPTAYCRGSQYQVLSLAFSPDGMLLASGGRGEARLWDVATGKLVLTLRGGDYLTGLAFAPDGRALVTSTCPPADPYVTVWRFGFGAAGRRYLGLSGQVASVIFSPDGQYVAALAHNWRVGVWDLERQTLVHVFAAPRGFTADNAAMAFSRDGSQLAFSTMPGVRLWEVESGRTVGEWTLPGGLCDCLAFDAGGRLLSLRVETLAGDLPPLSNTHPPKHPRVARIRQLVPKDETAMLAEIDAFNWHVHSAVASPDGSYFVIDGLNGPDRNRLQRMIKVFDPLGNELADIPHQLPATAAGVLNIDPTGTRLTAFTDTSQQSTLLEMPLGKYRGKLAAMAAAQSPKTAYWVRKGVDGQWDRGMWLYRRGEDEPIVGLGIDVPVTSVPSFDTSGRFFAWGSEDGTVSIVDIQRCNESLNALDSTW